MTDIKKIQTRWPDGWDKTYEAVCSFYNIRAHAASHSMVLLLTSNGAPFARVPTDITLKNLQLSLPLLLDSYEMGIMIGEARIKARIRDLVGKDPELNITERNGFDHSHGG